MLLATPIPAANVTLNFNSLPSAQGWFYEATNEKAELDIFSVNGGTLFQNSLFGLSGYNVYRRNNAVTLAPFTLSLRAHVLEDFTGDLNDPAGFACAIFTGAEMFALELSTNRIRLEDTTLGPDQAVIFDFDNTQFHDYRLEGTPGLAGMKGTYRLFIDGTLMKTVTARPLDSFPGALFLGDLTGGQGARAEVSSFSYVSDDAGPILSNLMANPNPLAINTSTILTANVDDSTTGGSNIASAAYNIDGGTFFPMNATDDAFDEPSEDVNANVPTFSATGVYNLC
ncbi:MAG: hypothetical protein HY236_15025, partial [Acidobacteria bacterium]|nr:hypothetical protein [Acidobacteriota bacterium]